MREFDPAFAAHIAGETTTLCTCWKLTRTDGVELGFTDHDRALLFAGQTFQANSGFSPAALEEAEGFAPDSSGIEGLLNAPDIYEADLEAGLFSGATVEIWRVNWRDVSVRALMWAGRIGETRTRDGLFEAVLNGPAALLERSTGRVFARSCAASFGDSQCGLNPVDFPPGTTCPKTWRACQEFSNTINFRGFPYLLGEDAVYAAPRAGEPKDGMSRYTHG